MYVIRLWVTRHARSFEVVHDAVALLLMKLEPMVRRVGHERAERPVAAAEAWVKGVLFDCRMCGRCILPTTGMTCPMNCPKDLRNGPCGGVRAGGHCEVKPEMRCVWAEAVAGSGRMRNDEAIQQVQTPVEHNLAGRSEWLRMMRETAAERPAARERGVGR